MERLVDAQLGALKEALHGAIGRARAGIGNDPSDAHAEFRLVARLARSSAKLASAFACLKPIRHTLTVNYIGPEGRVLKQRTSTWMQERTVPLPRPSSLSDRRKEQGGGGTPAKNEVRMLSGQPGRGAQPGNTNHLSHGRWSRASESHRAEVRRLIHAADGLIVRLAMVLRMRRQLHAETAAKPGIFRPARSTRRRTGLVLSPTNSHILCRVQRPSRGCTVITRNSS